MNLIYDKPFYLHAVYTQGDVTGIIVTQLQWTWHHRTHTKLVMGLSFSTAHLTCKRMYGTCQQGQVLITGHNNGQTMTSVNACCLDQHAGAATTAWYMLRHCWETSTEM